MCAGTLVTCNFTTMMTKVASIFIGVFITVQAAAVYPQDCGERMQSQLKELLATKQTCDSAFFRDCCTYSNSARNESMFYSFSDDTVFPKCIVTGVFELRVFRAPPLTPFTPPPTYIAARCDMETDGGGWMVIQRRVTNGTINFTRDWDDYVSGFGDLDGEFWYGLDNVHYLTTRDDVELRIDMVMEDDGSELTWTYQTFTVAGPEDKYRLTIGGGVGTGTDAMDYHDGQQFSTYDM